MCSGHKCPKCLNFPQGGRSKRAFVPGVTADALSRSSMMLRGSRPPSHGSLGSTLCQTNSFSSKAMRLKLFRMSILGGFVRGFPVHSWHLQPTGVANTSAPSVASSSRYPANLLCPVRADNSHAGCAPVPWTKMLRHTHHDASLSRQTVKAGGWSDLTSPTEGLEAGSLVLESLDKRTVGQAVRPPAHFLEIGAFRGLFQRLVRASQSTVAFAAQIRVHTICTDSPGRGTLLLKCFWADRPRLQNRKAFGGRFRAKRGLRT